MNLKGKEKVEYLNVRILPCSSSQSLARCCSCNAPCLERGSSRRQLILPQMGTSAGPELVETKPVGDTVGAQVSQIHHVLESRGMSLDSVNVT